MAAALVFWDCYFCFSIIPNWCRSIKLTMTAPRCHFTNYVPRSSRSVLFENPQISVFLFITKPDHVFTEENWCCVVMSLAHSYVFLLLFDLPLLVLSLRSSIISIFILSPVGKKSISCWSTDRKTNEEMNLGLLIHAKLHLNELLALIHLPTFFFWCRSVSMVSNSFFKYFPCVF